MGLHQAEKFMDIPETINTVKRQLTESEKIFANYTSDKGASVQNKREFNSITRKQMAQFKNRVNT
jgi:hypothetical protein